MPCALILGKLTDFSFLSFFIYNEGKDPGISKVLVQFHNTRSFKSKIPCSLRMWNAPSQDPLCPCCSSHTSLAVKSISLVPSPVPTENTLSRIAWKDPRMSMCQPWVWQRILGKTSLPTDTNKIPMKEAVCFVFFLFLFLDKCIFAHHCKKKMQSGPMYCFLSSQNENILQN